MAPALPLWNAIATSLEERPIPGTRKGQTPMDSLLQLVQLGLSIYSWVIIAAVLLSLLVSFRIINGYRPEVRNIGSMLDRLTEPVLAPIRRRLPSMGGLDLSPVVALLGISVIQILIDKFRIGTLL